ncbi:MAG: hypothetical protein QW327_04915, partial [Candidatus Odinarchaeota archaeon]
SVDELLEKLKSGGITQPSGGPVDTEGLSSVLTVLNEEIAKLQTGNLEQTVKTGFEELKGLFNEIKEAQTSLKEGLPGAGGAGVNVSEVVNRVEELQSSVERINNQLQELASNINEKLSKTGVSEGAVSSEKLEELITRLDKIDSGLNTILERETVSGEGEPDGLKEAVKKIVSAVLDLRAVVESSEESFIYGLKLIENNIRKDLSELGVRGVSCVEDAFEKLRNGLDKNGKNEEVYDALLDVLYHVKNNNKFDDRISVILGFIRELREKPPTDTIEGELKKKIKAELFSS